MTSFARTRKSMAQNPNWWITAGGLTLVVIFLIISVSWGFSFFYFFLFGTLGLIGAIALMPEDARLRKEQQVEDKLDENIVELMHQIQARCDEILIKEIDVITEPMLGSIRDDFYKSLNWLWEDGENYLTQVDWDINETQSVIQMLNTLSDDSMQIKRKLQAELDILIEAVAYIRRCKERDNESLEQCLADKAKDLQAGIEGEKELFYEYVQKLLVQQIKNSQEGLDIADYFDASQLGKQFSMVIEKSIQGRLSHYKDSIIQDLEEMSANIVGRMQSGALRVMNVFKNIENLIDKLVDEYRGNDSLDLKKIGDLRHRISQLKEQANEIMITLAWQDILVEKRWQDTQEKLFIIKDKVMINVSGDVLEYLQNSLEGEIVGYRVMADTPRNALIYKAVLDAEVIGDGVNSLLQFIRPLKLMVSREIRLSDYLLNKRRYIKDQIRQAEYQQIWDKLIAILEGKNADLPAYLDNMYPLGFSSFCNSPYIRQKPENLNQAAWMIFMVLVENQGIEDEVYLLVGLLLIMHVLRNKYIHPLKSTPLPLQEFNEIRHMRYCAWQSMKILQNLDMKTLLTTKRQLA